MDKPLVTVITPVYNCEKYIEATIRSVLTQWYINFEYIVIDDCSTDNTDWRIRFERDSLIKIYHHEKNIGEQATVNELLKTVKGKYFMIVNADDPLLPGAIETLVDFMESHPDVLCAYPDWDMINEDGSLKMHMKTREYDFRWMVAHHTWIPSVGSIFRSDVIKTIGYRDTTYHWLGDADYWLRIGLAGKMARVPATLATWRYRAGQASQDKSDARAKEHMRIMDDKEGFYSNPDLPEELWNVRYQAWCWSYIVAASVAKSKRLVAECLFRALMAYPQALVSPGFWGVLAEKAQFVLRRQT